MPGSERDGAAGLGAGPCLALAALHGLLFVLVAEVDPLWPLSFLVPVPLAWLAVRARSTRTALLVTALAALAAWLWIERWIVTLTVAGYPIMTLYLALYAVIFVWIVRRWSRAGFTRAVPMSLLVPLAWVGLECLRGELAFHGYGWFLLAHPLVDWAPFAQSADLLGTYFVSFLVAMPSGLLVDVAGRRGARSASPSGSSRLEARDFLAPGLVLLALVLNLLYGAWRLGQDATSPGPAILVVQTNLPQDNKIGWTAEAQARDVPGFIEQTRAAVAAAGGPVDLVVWPETMVPGAGLEPDTTALLREFGAEYEHLQRWGGEVVRLSRELDVPMLVGSTAWVGPGLEPVDGGSRMTIDREYNSAYLIDGVPPFQRYDKSHLTPFGETMPYISAIPWLEEKLLGIGAPGMSFSLDGNPEPAVLRLDTGAGPLRLATPICYEDTVGRVCRRMVYDAGRKRADVLVNLSNDGWFGDFDLGRRQHGRIARYRCIENRVPLLRAANTGLSAAFDSCGRIEAAIGAGRYGAGRQAGWLRVEPALDRRRTLYGRAGDAFAWGCLALAVVLSVWAAWPRRRATSG